MNILGQRITWHDKGLLSQALTHRSVGKGNNERLEFLGDSVLSLVISTHLYNHYPQLSEGALSRLRSQLVKGKTLAEVARHYQLGSTIKLGQGEIKSGGVNKSSVLADAVEAVFGAVLLDQGYAYAESFVAAVMQPWLEKIDPSVIKKDPKSHLQEVLQKQGLALPVYKTIKEEEGNEGIQFTVTCQVIEKSLLVQAKASSRKKAEQACAEQMVEKFHG